MPGTGVLKRPPRFAAVFFAATVKSGMAGPASDDRCEAPRARGGACGRPATRGDGDDRALCAAHRPHGECAICLSDMCRRDLSALPCGHRFHARCLRGWFRARTLTCPMCRATCIGGMKLLGRRLRPKMEALVRTAPREAHVSFANHIVAQLHTPAVVDALGEEDAAMLSDIALWGMTHDNFFAQLRAARL